ncbi:MAG TPA: hypothetical protein GX708_03840 [Gallicola sp.]|nr:hypothetical protein [Gallicola sp.]
MTRNEILETFKQLAQGQGFYGRLLASLEELKETDSKQYEETMQHLEEQNFKDSVDLVMYIEC